MKNFWKLEGAGNDFVFFESKPPARATAFVRELCDRRLGIGADGAVFLWSQKGRWQWSFRNPDGSEAEVCGNAARCVALWLFKRKPKAKQVEWRGLVGDFKGETKGRGYRVRWPLPPAAFRDLNPEFLEELTSGLNDRGLSGVYSVNVGNPHLVLLNHGEWNRQDRAASSAHLRSHPDLGPAGSNVTWVSKKGDDAKPIYEVVTFERGVEAETLACGSGALAAFQALRRYAEENGLAPPRRLDLRFPGGTLQVEESPEGLWLAGPAREVFRGELP
mgnify:CR=1 FL=1